MDSLKELKEMLIERYEYVADMYMISKSPKSKHIMSTRLKDIEKRIREIDEQMTSLGGA